MSNYLLVVSEHESASKIHRWLVRHGGQHQAEVMQLQLNEAVWLTYVSKRPASEFNPDQRMIFKGFAIDYENRSLSLGADGFSGYLKKAGSHTSQRPLEGCYLSVRWDEDAVHVSNDLFSLCPVLYTTGKAMVAVADSSMMLAELRRELGLPRELDQEAAIARSWQNAMAGQMLSQDTVVAQIKYLQVGAGLRVPLTEIEAKITRRSCYEDFSTEGATYAEGVRLAGQRMASLMGTISAISSNTARISLSGGMDSRTCLAAALASRAGREQAVFSCTNTNAGHARDFAVVESLREKFGFPAGLRGAGASDKGVFSKVKDELGLWFLSNAGIYDFLKFNPHVRVRGGAFSISGHGAELVKGNYGWRPIQAIAGNIKDPLVSAAFRAQSEGGLAAMGIDADDVYGSEWHYLGFRNAVHSGRFVPSTMMGFRPIMTRDLVALSRSSVNEWPAPSKKGQSLISDLLIYLSPSLAAHPFDDPHKNLADAIVADRSRYLGTLRADDLDEYRVFGTLNDVVNGFPQLFLGVLAARGLAYPADRAILARMVEQNYGNLGGAVRDSYGPAYEAATTKLAREESTFSEMRGDVGKFLAFELLS
ncbi:hypothetical protein FZO89_13185 [Luteimonas viscosa]|uniref:Asparagine synthase (Glutamine-hydrolysing) n=1 Tax=Luteimonas viscosa TaxID=1132694 RepID=A0A5D4XT22_9GAMM|nr:hypothetical protein [Luteimonas viscosa]TYT27135.1 hypothetical protein FZO89_13185 [Luteimonas viscosa]